MAGSRSALALISICILVTLSGLGDCRVPLQREEAVAGDGEKERSDHLLLPSEKEEFNERAREAQPLSLPLERPDLRGNDGIFHGERSKGFRFGRPGGCHHGKFNRRGQRNSEHMPFPVEFLDLQAESRDFHPKKYRPLPEKRDFDPGFSKGEWRHPEEEKREKENEHMPFPAIRSGWLESFFHPLPRHDDPADRHFHPRMDLPLPEERDFNPSFSKEERRHPEEKRGKEHEHMHFEPARRGWLEFFSHHFPRHDGPAEFHPREDEFRPEFGLGFPHGREGRQHRAEIGVRERDHEHMPFPEGQKEESFPHAFPVHPESTEFHSRVEEFMPLPRERDFEHGFPGREGRHGHGHGDEEKENEQMPFPAESFIYTFPVQAESTEFRSRVDKFLPLSGEGDFEHSFPGGEKGEERQRRGPYGMEG
ncbi:hypothetical protein SUGI_0975000 [Cryptomeria japonica]|nr:hypothetical protein SUGI_0975000 [Cryptomeria japonica]